MSNKSIETKQYIIEKIAPIFNKNGYVGTSLSDITQATGLTKGAIYGNFKDKEALALEAFNFNIKRYLGIITPKINHIDSPLAKLFGISNFYRNYYDTIIEVGGCPLLNLSVDTNNTNSILFDRAKDIITKLQNNMCNIILEGKSLGEIKESIDERKYAGLLFSLIEGAIFSSTIMKDETYLINMMNHVDQIINQELKF